MNVIDTLDWGAVSTHYGWRLEVHRRLLRLHDRGPSAEFSELLVGMEDSRANYSASEHRLGPKILASNANADRRLHELAGRFRDLESARSVPRIVNDAGLSYLAISVGSEASCMMNPQVCWVTNIRTLWMERVINNGDCCEQADELMKLYRDQERDLRASYKIWAQLHTSLGKCMRDVAADGALLAASAGWPQPSAMLLWADAIASELYEQNH